MLQLFIIHSSINSVCRSAIFSLNSFCISENWSAIRMFKNNRQIIWKVQNSYCHQSSSFRKRNYSIYVCLFHQNLLILQLLQQNIRKLIGWSSISEMHKPLINKMQMWKYKNQNYLDPEELLYLQIYSSFSSGTNIGPQKTLKFWQRWKFFFLHSQLSNCLLLDRFLSIEVVKHLWLFSYSIL